MKKALITGISGFVGSHLCRHLQDSGIQVFGITHPTHKNSQNIKNSREVKLFACDLLNEKELGKVLKNTSFNYIFHLAAFSSPAESFKNPDKILENNILAQLNLLELLVKSKSNAKILIVGSSEEYGDIDSNAPLDEHTPLAPQSPYAVSKVAQDFLGYQYFLHYKLNVVRVRPFNHIGPGQSPLFVVASFASQIASLEKRGGQKIKVGNLSSFRDFTDVRDMVKAYLLAAELGKPGEVYNIGSGKLYKISDILDTLLSFSKEQIKIVKDKNRLRQTVSKIYCDFTKFNKLSGWKPQIPIKKTLSDTIEYERMRI